MSIRPCVCGVVQMAYEGSCFQIERGDGAQAGVFSDEGITKSVVDLDVIKLELRIILRGWVNIGANWLCSSDIERYDLCSPCQRERPVTFRSA